MRNIFVLQDAILHEIPNNERWDALRNAVMFLTEQYKYRAPELHRPWFDEMAKILNGYLGKPNEPWKKKISDIFSDRIKL